MHYVCLYMHIYVVFGFFSLGQVPKKVEGSDNGGSILGRRMYHQVYKTGGSVHELLPPKP